MKSTGSIGRSAVRIAGLTILLIALLPLTTGCGGDDDGGTQPPPPDGETIGSGGGTATSDDDNATVTVPAGALTDETAITVATAAAPPPDYISGTAYDFGPDGTQFSESVTLTIGYAPGDLPTGTEPDSLKLCRAAGGWIPLADFMHDTGAHTLSGPVTHFSTYGIVAFDESEPADLTAYLKDEPAAGADDEFSTLIEALAWLQAGLDYEDTGTLVWQTDAVQQVDHLAFSFDLTIAVDPGRTPAIAGPAGDALVIDAGGAIALGEVAVTAPGGLVLNTNRALNVSGCDLPATVAVNIGGVRGAPYPAGDPGAISKSPAAHRRSRGTIIANNRGMQNLRVALNAAAQHSGDLTVSGNETTYLNVGGTSVLAPDVCLTVSGPTAVPIPYPNIAVSTDGTSQVQVLNMTGVVKLRTKVTAAGDNPIDHPGDSRNSQPGGCGRFRQGVAHVRRFQRGYDRHQGCGRAFGYYLDACYLPVQHGGAGSCGAGPVAAQGRRRDLRGQRHRRATVVVRPDRCDPGRGHTQQRPARRHRRAARGAAAAPLPCAI